MRDRPTGHASRAWNELLARSPIIKLGLLVTSLISLCLQTYCISPTQAKARQSKSKFHPTCHQRAAACRSLTSSPSSHALYCLPPPPPSRPKRQMPTLPRHSRTRTYSLLLLLLLRLTEICRNDTGDEGGVRLANTDRHRWILRKSPPTEHPNRSAYAKPQSRTTGLHIEDFQMSASSISHRPRIFHLGHPSFP